MKLLRARDNICGYENGKENYCFVGCEGGENVSTGVEFVSFLKVCVWPGCV